MNRQHLRNVPKQTFEFRMHVLRLTTSELVWDSYSSENSIFRAGTCNEDHDVLNGANNWKSSNTIKWCPVYVLIVRSETFSYTDFKWHVEMKNNFSPLIDNYHRYLIISVIIYEIYEYRGYYTSVTEWRRARPFFLCFLHKRNGQGLMNDPLPIWKRIFRNETLHSRSK